MIGLNVTNLAATATLSGGSWLAAAPVTNLATRDAADTARSTNANNSSTRIIVDHGAAVTRRVMDLREHNISSGATIRWSVGTSSGGNEVATTGTINAWQFTPRAFDGRDHGLIFVLPADATGRYDYIEIFDSSNADGYVEIAQLGIGPIDFVPSYNAAYGLKDGFVSFGGKERSSGGTLWTDQQRIARNVSFVLEAIDLDNGDSLHELERYVGTTEQVLYLPDLHDAAAIQRYGMRGTLDELSALDYPYYRLRSMPLRITQD